MRVARCSQQQQQQQEEEEEEEDKTYKQMTLHKMMMSKWKMFAMPSAKQRIMQSTPVLVTGVLAFAQRVRWEAGRLRIPLSVYTCKKQGQQLFTSIGCQWLSQRAGASLLKFRDLNSSASVMLGAKA